MRTDFEPQLETRELCDGELDGVAGGGLLLSKLDSAADVISDATSGLPALPSLSLPHLSGALGGQLPSSLGGGQIQGQFSS